MEIIVTRHQQSVLLLVIPLNHGQLEGLIEHTVRCSLLFCGVHVCNELIHLVQAFCFGWLP